MSTEITRIKRDGEKGGGVGRGGMEVNTQTWCLMSTETTRLNRDGEKGGEGGYQGGGGGGELKVSLHRA